MKITVFNGSPRAENSNTHFMVEQFSKGAEQAGAEVENIFLAKKEIKPCRGCFSCWLKTPGRCVTKDDMTELIEKIKDSDVVVFATPLYVDNVTGIMKNFMDRIIATGDPHIEKDENGESVHVTKSEKRPKLVVISNCGFPEQSHFQVLALLFKRIARNIRTEVIGEIYRGGGAILKDAPLILKPLIMKYSKLLQKAGREIAENNQLSKETRQELEKPLIPADTYIAAANKYFDQLLSSA